ncbi:MAG: bifunctional precorrin-2 dehydrogenase/sirohydrochlorin ferrochelatase [Actinomycetota bacterium]
MSRVTELPETAADAAIPLVPVGLRVTDRAVLVVGAGPIAARKATAYVTNGAVVTVVAPHHGPEMDRLPVAHRIRRGFQPGDLDGMWLAVTATGIPSVDGAVFAEAETRRIWCNAADDPEHCSVLLPAVVRRGPVTIGIASGGTSPAVASWLRRLIEALLDDRTLAVAEVTARVRRAVRDAGHRTEVPGWSEVLDDRALDLVAAGQPEELERELFAAVVGS